MLLKLFADKKFRENGQKLRKSRNLIPAKFITLTLIWLGFLGVRFKVTINENISFTDYASGIQLPDCSKLAVNWKNGNDVTIFRHGVSSNVFEVALFLLSSLVTGPSFMPISSLVQEL